MPTTRAILTAFAGVVAVYWLTTCFLFEQLDEGSTRYLPAEQTKCVPKGQLIESALGRAKTDECKRIISDTFCHETFSPPVTIENTCTDFDRSKSGEWLGCFSTIQSSAGFTYSFPTDNSPDYCVQTCLRAGYEFAAVSNGSTCSCADSEHHRGHQVASGELCDVNKGIPCPGAANETCGTQSASSFFSTGVRALQRHFPIFTPLPELEGERKRVKILFVLQLNGRNTRQVVRMLRTVYSERHLYFVHVDSRQKFMHAEMKALQAEITKRTGKTNLVVVDDRFTTIWGAATLLSMFLSVVNSTLQDPAYNDWDYVLNMSESDMLLLPLEELEHNLAMANGKSFLASHGYNTASFIRKQGFGFVFVQCDNHMWRIMNRVSFPRNYRIDGGSDWVVVHRSLAQTATTDSLVVRQLVKHFSTILLPLESFFHTLALNSEHCGDVLYKNLRLTNWRRQQGCRCAVLTPVVDWCGCSPLVFRGVGDVRLTRKSTQQKAQFFARKFDSFVDPRPIVFAEKEALNRRPDLLKKLAESPVAEAVWINQYDRAIDGDHRHLQTITGIAKVLFTDWKQGQDTEKCQFLTLNKLWAYKSSAGAQSRAVFSVSDSCHNDFDLLIQRVNIVEINRSPLDEAEFNILDAEFGTGLDLKEEIFRDAMPIVDVVSQATVYLRWQRNSTYSARNETSPMTNLQWWNPAGRLVKQSLLQPYNSIFGGQIASLDLSEKPASEAVPGMWSARVLARDSEAPMVEVHFPVFPADRESAFFAKLAKMFYLTEDACSIGHVSPRIGRCESRLWSPAFPDISSELFAA